MSPAQDTLSKVWPALMRRAAAVFLVAAILSFGAVSVTKPGRPLDGDAPEYLSIAQALAQGKGFIAPLSPWPEQPSMARAPLWSAVTSIPLVLFPSVNPRALLRYETAFINVLTCLLLFFLTQMLTRDPRLSMLVGLAAAVYPVSIFLVVSGYCEILALFLLCLACIAILAGGRLFFAGSFLLGLVPLVRTNFVILPLCTLFLWFVFRRGVRIAGGAGWKKLGAAGLLFALPSLFWLARNYEVSGRFPLLSTLEGETLYGSNNLVVANQFVDWGYWIMPDQVPGERPLRELAREMSEVQVNDYYHRKGVAFWREHWLGMPRLIVGKMVRGFVPIPFRVLLPSYVVFLFRAIVYLALLLSLYKSLHSMNPTYTYLYGSVFIVVLITTVTYYGNYRFSYLFEPLALPLVAVAVRDRALQRQRSLVQYT